VLSVSLTLTVSGCAFDWDTLDPRATDGTGGAGMGGALVGAGGVGGTATGTGSPTGTATGTSAGTGASGGGVVDPCADVTCDGDDECIDGICVGAIELVTNGDFGDGLNGWTTDNNPVNDNDTMVTFTVSGGVCENESSSGPSARVIYQDLAIPSVVADADFSLSFAQDNDEPLDPQNVTVIEKDPTDQSMNGLDENAFRIDLIDATGDVFYATIEVDLFSPTMAMGSPSQLVMVSDPVAGLVDTLQSHAGGTLRLRIAQVESTFPWSVYVDDVSLVVQGQP